MQHSVTELEGGSFCRAIEQAAVREAVLPGSRAVKQHRQVAAPQAAMRGPHHPAPPNQPSGPPAEGQPPPCEESRHRHEWRGWAAGAATGPRPTPASGEDGRRQDRGRKGQGRQVGAGRQVDR